MNMIPSYKDTAPAEEKERVVLPEGSYDLALVKSGLKSAGSLDIAELLFRVDNGEQAGGYAEGALFYGQDTEKNDRSNSNLRSFAMAARTDDGTVGEHGYVWKEDAQNLAEFFEQFAQTPPLRVHARVYHSFDVKVAGVWKNGLYEREKNDLVKEATEDGEEVKVFTKPKVALASCKPPKEASELYNPRPATGMNERGIPTMNGTSAAPKPKQPPVVETPAADPSDLPF